MGLLDGLFGGLNAATQAKTGQLQGQQQESALMRAIQGQQIQWDKEKAETALTNRKIATPILGETGYTKAKGDEAGAIEEAKSPIQTRTAVNTATGLIAPHVQQEREMTPVLADRTQQTELAKFAPTVTAAKKLDFNTLTPSYAARKGAEDWAGVAPAVDKASRIAKVEQPFKVEQADHLNSNRLNNRLETAASSKFSQEQKPLVDAVQPYALAKNAFTEARKGNPAALESALMAFAGVADPKARLTQGIIKMVSDVDPSINGRLDLALNRLGSGRLPPRILDQMEQMVDRTHETHKALFDQRRREIVTRLPGLDNYIPTTQGTFDVPGLAHRGAPTTPATGGEAAHPVLSKYGIPSSHP